MSNLRTDLALEAREIWKESAKDTSEINGVEVNEYENSGMKVTHVRITNENGADTLKKPVGTYVTVGLEGVSRRESDMFPRAIDVLSNELSKLLPENPGTVLVAGLGNREITPDAIGHSVVEHIMVTRHLIDALPDMFGKLHPVCAIAPGVIGMTGIESSEIILGAVRHINPDCVIVVDALASRRLNRLCSTVQITDTGITPGSGVGNARREINGRTMGVPVIAMGVPTVVDIRTLLSDTATDAGFTLGNDALAHSDFDLMVTPKEIDVRISDIGRIVGYAINKALQKGITVEDMDMFLS